MDNTNFFKHAPTEHVTEAFLTWLFYFLDSDKSLEKHKKGLFNDLLLYEDDYNKEISDVEVKRQVTKSHGRSDMILSFKLDGEMQKILFENKTWTSTDKDQLSAYKADNPGSYKYIYLKLAYVNYYEIKLTQEVGYEIIDVFKLSKALSNISTLHPFIAQYLEYINETFKKFIDSFKVKLFQDQNYNILWSGQAQEFLMSELYKNLDNKLEYLYFKTGSSSGRPWTELDIAKKNNVYADKDESIFWRIDIRSGKFYIRLNQYADIEKDFKEQKFKRLALLREIANDLIFKYKLNPGKLSNKGLKESEIVIFFLEENNLEYLMNVLPLFSVEFVKEYQNRL